MEDLQKRLFRQVALERLSTPDQLDQLMKVTRPRSWLGLLGVWLVIATATLWGVFGSLPTVVSGQGILLRDGSIQTVDSPASGQVDEILVNVGDEIRQSQVVARLFQQGDVSREGSDSRSILVTSPHAGRVIEMRVRRGNVLQMGTTMLSLEIAGRSLEGILYLPPFEGKKVRPGMEVQLSPAPVKREEYGLMVGRVLSVGQLPASVDSMRRVLGNDDLARNLSRDGAPIEIRVELLRSPATVSGFQWTSTLPSSVSAAPGSAFGYTATTVGSVYASAVGLLPAEWQAHLAPELPPDLGTGLLVAPAPSPGPPIRIESGTPTTADVIAEEQAPIFLVLAKMNR